MKRFLPLCALVLGAVLLVPSVALAAKPINSGGSGGNKPAPSQPAELKGYDISYPQCGTKKLPTDHYFGIVGVNAGTATTTNPCLSQQLAWAKSAKAGSNQPKIQLYVNTANPAQDSVYNWASWPTSSTANNPYGTCAGDNDLACSWQYGWNRSVETDLDRFVPAARAAGISTNAGDYTWWLDVETMNSWQAGSADALARNTAAIEGFAAYYQSKDTTVGLYSTKPQWEQIVGTTLITNGNLVALPNWRPSGASLSSAIANCSVAPLTAGGYISLTQYIVKNLDTNHSCI